MRFLARAKPKRCGKIAAMNIDRLLEHAMKAHMLLLEADYRSQSDAVCALIADARWEIERVIELAQRIAPLGPSEIKTEAQDGA
mgnify:CR=1 FL=1